MVDYTKRRLDAKSYNSQDMLLTAVHHGDLTKVKEALSSGRHNLKNSIYVTFAAELGYINMVKLLVTSGVNPNQVFMTHNTALSHACRDANQELFDFLIANPHVKLLPSFPDKSTPFDILLTQLSKTSRTRPLNISLLNQLETMCLNYCEALSKQNAKPNLELLALKLAQLLDVGLVRLSFAIVRHLSEVEPVFSWLHQKSISQYACQETTVQKEKELRFFRSGNVFTTLRNKECGERLSHCFTYGVKPRNHGHTLNGEEAHNVILAASSTSSSKLR